MNEVIQTVQSVAASAETGDALHLIITNAGPTNRLITVNGRFRNADSSISRIAETRTITAGTTDRNWFIRLTRGQIVQLSITADLAEEQHGTVFATASISSGNDTTDANELNLTHGFTSYGRPLNYPYGEPQSDATIVPTASKVTANDADPAGELAYNFGPNALAEIVGGRLFFDTESTAANRTINARYYSDGQEAYNVSARSIATANKIYKVIFWCGSGIPTDANDIIYLQLPRPAPLPRLQIFISYTNPQNSDVLRGCALYARITAKHIT